MEEDPVMDVAQELSANDAGAEVATVEPTGGSAESDGTKEASAEAPNAADAETTLANLIDEDELALSDEQLPPAPAEGDAEGQSSVLVDGEVHMVMKRPREEDDEDEYSPDAKRIRLEAEDPPDENAEDADKDGKVLTEDEKLSLEFKKVTESSKKRRRKQDDDIASERRQVSEMIDAMQKLDDEALSNGSPALRKLMLLPKLRLFLQKRMIMEGQFEPSFLSALKSWLAPYPDRSLPNMKIRTEIIQALLKMELDQDMLMSAQIGRPILLLLKHPDETLENKRICKQLISRWSAPIFNDNNQKSFRPPTRPQHLQRRRSSLAKKRKSSGNALDNALSEKSEREGATPYAPQDRYRSIRPEKMEFSFEKQPASGWTEREKPKKKEEKSDRRVLPGSLKKGSRSRSRSIASLSVNRPGSKY